MLKYRLVSSACIQEVFAFLDVSEFLKLQQLNKKFYRDKIPQYLSFFTFNDQYYENIRINEPIDLREIREIESKIIKYEGKRDRYNVELHKEIRKNIVECMLITMTDIRLRFFDLSSFQQLTKSEVKAIFT